MFDESAAAVGCRYKTSDRWSDPKKRLLHVVYFGAFEGSGWIEIKLGQSKNWQVRFAQHRKDAAKMHATFTPLCMVRGRVKDEDALKRHFADIAVGKAKEERFKAVPRIVDYIRWLRDQYFVWVPDDSLCEDIEQHDEVDSSLWMPGNGRTKEPPHPTLFSEEHGPLRMPPRQITQDDFYTSEEIIQCARIAFGGRIDLDPASHPVANRVVGAKRFFTIADNGLAKQWSGSVWLNPPFSEWQCWVPKVLAEWGSGRVTSMCVLAATRTITAQYFSPIHEHTKALCVFRGRIPFWGALATPSPDDGHCVFYFGPDVDVSRFTDAFRKLGKIYHT